MYKLVPWTPDLDLTEFYATAKAKGFNNNSSQAAMVDCFEKEKEKQVWILYEGRRAIGSVGAHTLDILGPNAYRICARTCSFADSRPKHGLLTVNRMLKEHQFFTSQFFIPACITWAGTDKDLYISTHPSTVGTQRLVHSILMPTWESTGVATRICDLDYRGHTQTFWKLHSDVFLKQLNSYPRWPGTINI
jgi:hypothetical protein